MKKKTEKLTTVFSYQVRMLVHVIADSAEEARQQLDEKGGIMTAREVELLNASPLYGEKETK
jgi:hypothetical protein